ncbi:MAG: hypothetical protein C5B50_02180 [Verrucomicrobia bacterium]|nr:MAG: hypothetical protein C5B50_02180 [Verrucomicrobiota bacterium]
MNMKKLVSKKLNFISLSLCLLFCGFAGSTQAANSYYYHLNGTATAYGINANDNDSWDGTFWATTSTGAPTSDYPTAVAASTAAGGVFPRFNSSATPYTVTVNNSEAMAGMFGASGVTITIAAAGGGNLNVVPNATLTGGLPVQGFFTGGGNLLITAPITGTGGVSESAGGGNFELLGNNSYSGGTVFNSSGTLTYFNNNNSFGTGPIVINGTTFAPILGTGGNPITIANNWTNGTATSASTFGVNYAADAGVPVTLTGPYFLFANLNLRNNGGGGTAPLTLSGTIAGTGNLNLTANNSSSITLSGNNTYTGQTTLGGGGASGSTVTLIINSLKNLSTSCSLGAPTTTAAGTIGLGNASVNAALVYQGAGDTCNRVIDLSGSGSPVGSPTIEADGTGALVLTAVNTASGAASKTLTLQGSNTGNNSIGTIVDNSGANKTSVVKAQAGKWVLTAANSYTGGTTVNQGSLEVSGSIAGNVTNNAGATLQLDSTTALASSAAVSLSSGGTINLNFSGTQNIAALIIDGTLQPSGSYGASGSGAGTTLTFATGSGKLNVLGSPVIVQEPASVTTYPTTNVTFSVSVIGDPSFTYQWSLNGTAISGATTSAWSTNAYAGDAGTYTCFIHNNFGNTNTLNTTGILTVLATNVYTETILGDGPIAYWRLDEASGTTANDYVGGNNGTYNNATINDNNGYAAPIDTDACMGVPNSGSPRGYMKVNNGAPFVLSGAGTLFTLEAWATFTNLTTKGRLFSTLSLANPNGYAFGVLPGGTALEFTAGAVADNDVNLSTALIADGKTWYHLVCAYDGSDYNFYVNGALVGQVAITGHAVNGTSGTLQLGANPSAYVTGGSDGGAEQVYGRIDEAAFYNYALTQLQVTNHFNARYGSLQVPIPTAPVVQPPTNYVSLSAALTENAAGTALSYQWYKIGTGLLGGKTDQTLTISPLHQSDAGSYYCNVSNPAGNSNSPTSTLTVLPIPTSAAQLHLTNGLVLHLPFDGDYKDISGRGHDGTAVGAPTFSTPAAIGSGSLHYSTTPGSTNYVTLGVVQDLKFTSNIDFSVSYWVKQTAGSTNLPFFGDAVGSTSLAGTGFSLAPYQTASTTGGWQVSLSDGTHAMTTPSQFTTFPDANLIDDGNWHLLTHVFSRPANVTTYLDGSQVDSEAISFIVNVNNNNPAVIGQDPTGAYFPGLTADAYVDDLGVWTRTLSSLEVSGIYLAGSSNSVSFAALPLAPVTIAIPAMGATTLSYSGGAGSQFVLLSTTVATTPGASWTRVATNTVTPGSFSIPAIGSPGAAKYYRIQSQ